MIPANAPAYYRDPDAGTAEAETRGFIGYVRSMAGNESGLVLPVITPRFIPSCTDELLRGLGRLASGDRLPCANALLGERLGP